MTDPGAAGAARPDERHRDSYDDDEIDLLEYVRTLWRYRTAIAGATLLCAVSAIGLTGSSPRNYTAEATVAVSSSKLTEPSAGGVFTTAPSGGDGGSTADFRPYIESQSIATKVISELGLGEARYALSPSTLFGSTVTIEEVRGSAILRIRASLSDPGLAARLANRVAQLAVEATRRASNEEAASTQRDLEAQLADARASSERAESELRARREASQLELLRKDVDGALDQRGGLSRLLVSIETEKARLADAEKQMSERTRVETLTRPIDSHPALGATADATRPAGVNALGPQLKGEFVDEVYRGLDKVAAESRTNLAQMEREKAELIGVRKLDAGQMQLLTRLYQVETDLSRLEAQRDLARKVYLEVAMSYETARLQVAGRTAQLRIIEPAVAPDMPEPRHLARTTLIAIAAGFMLSSMGALLHGALSADKRAASPPQRA